MGLDGIKSQNEKYCKDCGAIINAKAEICPNCGVRQISSFSTEVDSITFTTSNGKNKLVASLFAVILGGIGIHKFYLGQIGLGVLYLLFCWTGIPSIMVSLKESFTSL